MNMNKYFREMNVNPKNKKTSDCVVRALYMVTENSIEDIISQIGAFSPEIHEIPELIRIPGTQSNIIVGIL